MSVSALFAGAERAAAMPFSPVAGVQSDVTVDDVLNGGWTTVYSGKYNETVSYSDAFNNLEDWIGLASREVGNDTFDLIAFLRVDDWNNLPAGENVTETHNGVVWYRNGGSLGFAPGGATIAQGEADLRSGDQRLSWTTDGGIASFSYDAQPSRLDGGVRSGDNTRLNDSTDWERFILTASDQDVGVNAPTPIPLPAGAWLLLSCMGGLAVLRRFKTA
jgi:hypothetical protein